MSVFFDGVLLDGLIDFGPQSAPAQSVLHAVTEGRVRGRHDGVAGGRIYDAHIAEGARAVRATVIVTDNRRHFLSALRYDMRVETPAEFLIGLKDRK